MGVVPTRSRCGQNNGRVMASAIPSSGLQSPGAGDDFSPGEVILKNLFAQFVVRSDAKLKHIAAQRQVNE